MAESPGNYAMPKKKKKKKKQQQQENHHSNNNPKCHIVYDSTYITFGNNTIFKWRAD